MACADIMPLYSLIKLFHMKILIIHQNFLSQYEHLCPVLAHHGDRVVVLTPKVKERATWQEDEIIPYKIVGSSSKEIHAWLRDLEAKVICAEDCFNAAIQLREQGFLPNVILAHPDWGELMFSQDIWPKGAHRVVLQMVP